MLKALLQQKKCPEQNVQQQEHTDLIDFDLQFCLEIFKDMKSSNTTDIEFHTDSIFWNLKEWNTQIQTF